MGGFGSGRWHRWNSKPIVEHYPALNVNHLARHRLLRPDCTGSLVWPRIGTGRRILSAQFFVGPDYQNEFGQCRFLTVRCQLSGEEFDRVVLLRPTPQHFGGQRWWLVCPNCGGRFGKLYWKDLQFTCRRCGGMTYYSSKTAHERERAIMSVSRMYDRHIGLDA